MRDRVHTTREGKQIPFGDIEDSHLINILRYKERWAENGIKAVSGGVDLHGAWADVDILYGGEAKRHTNYHYYAEEARKRGLVR